MVALKSKYTYNVYTIIALSLECLRHTWWDSSHSTRLTTSLFNLDHIGSFCLFLSRNCRTWFLDVSSFILCFSITGQKFHWGTYLWGSKFNYLLVKLTYVLCRPLFLYNIFQLFQLEFCHWMKQAAVEFFRLEFCSKKYIRFTWPVQLRSQKGLIDAYMVYLMTYLRN